MMGGRGQLNLNLQNHCLFCLRPQAAEKLVEVAERNPGQRKDLRHVIQYLMGTESDGGKGEEKEDLLGILEVDKLPPVVCPSCHDILFKLHRLHRKLVKTQRLIREETECVRRKIVSKMQDRSSSLSRHWFYSKIQSCGIAAEEVAAVIKFVGGLHDQIVFKASVKPDVKCTATFPPDSPPYVDAGDDPASPCQSVDHNSSKLISLTLAPPPSSAPALEMEDVDIKSENEEVEKVDDEPDRLLELAGVSPPLADDVENIFEADLQSPSPMESNLNDPYEDYIPSSPEQEQPPTPPPTRSVLKRKGKESPTRMSDEGKKKCTENVASAPSMTPRISAITGRRIRKDLRIRKRPQLVRSLVVDGNTTSQYCDLCGELCPSSEIASHLVSHHHVQDFMVKCPNRSCPYVFSCRGKLERHLAGETRYRNKHLKEDRNNCRRKAKLPAGISLRKCAVCGFKTKSMVPFHDHLMKVHESESGMEMKTLDCPLPTCPKKFTLRQSVEEHLFTHDEEDMLRYTARAKIADGLEPMKQKCDLCGETVAVTEMQEHLEEAHHLQNYLTKCLNPECPMVFSCRGKMEKHLASTKSCKKAANLPRGQKNTTKCESCGLEVSKIRFLDHLADHEYRMKDKSLPCPISGCPDRYALRQSMEDHLMTHDLTERSNPSKQECSVCKLTVEVKDVEDHLKEAHGVQDVIRCKRCPLQFHDWEALLDHLGEEHRSRKKGSSGGGGFNCDICADSVKFMRYDILRHHFYDVHKIGSLFTCENCRKHFYCQRTLSLHKEKAHSEKQDEALSKEKETKTKRSFKCEICPDAVFSTDGGLYSHKIKMHGAPLPTCPFCNQLFPSLGALQKHKRTHLGLAVKEYKCNFEGCGRIFKEKHNWRSHQLGAHRKDSDPKEFICDVCGKGFYAPSRLIAHVNRVHLKKNQGPRIICEQCGESFSSRKAVEVHKLIHTGERPFDCPICHQAFRHKNALQTHLKAHEQKGNNFKPNGPMKNIRKRVEKRKK